MTTPFYNHPEVKVALYIGSRMSEFAEQRDLQPDTDLFRRVVGSVKEILEEAVRQIAPEIRERNRQVNWRDVDKIPKYTIGDIVDLDEHVFWQIIKRQLPLLINAVNIVVKLDDSTNSRNKGL